MQNNEKYNKKKLQNLSVGYIGTSLCLLGTKFTDLYLLQLSLVIANELTNRQAHTQKDKTSFLLIQIPRITIPQGCLSYFMCLKVERELRWQLFIYGINNNFARKRSYIKQLSLNGNVKCLFLFSFYTGYRKNSLILQEVIKIKRIGKLECDFPEIDSNVGVFFFTIKFIQVISPFLH